MALDDELMNRSGNQGKEADNSGSNALDSGYEDAENSADRAGALRMAKKGAGVSESQGDLRADRMAEKRKQSLKEKANKALTKALSPVKKALSGLLKASWENLIDSFGATLLWIDAHVFMSMIFGNKIFCDLGEEWIPDKPGVPSAKK